ncbi:glycosyltransferase family 4 protein [Flavobacterium amniphilum]|uniref:glycosyltransferase family 4 protein n=1 Tax=Flavobacterium amniphilum TaxID=1834035 RepID=UPI002029D1A8|nr:glycosyltransferase family 4 protein [Flavobacterium amniphilum]MCL9805128.1 glycosyltransferase family 4 protein [Flavobacterium amniphilum]
MKKKKLVRITTVPVSLEKLLTGQLDFMNGFYEVIAVSSEKERLEKYVNNEGVSGFYVKMTRKITPFSDLVAIWKLFFFLRREKPFLVHSHTPKAGMVGMIAAKLAGVPNRWHTVAGLPLLEVSGFKRKILDLVEKITYACATKVLPNSFGLKEIILESNYCKPEKIKVIGHGSSNGIDTSYFDPELYNNEEKEVLRQKWGIKPEDFVFIFVGRLVSDKGINELIRSFGELSKSTENMKLLLVGDLEENLDPLLPETLELIKNDESVIWVGYQNDVRPFFSISNVLTFPSYREGFPNVVMQAGAMKVPSIVSNINGCNEIIKHGVNGLIVPVKDGKALLESMEFICKNQDVYKGILEKSRNEIQSKYERKVIWEALLNEYRNLE